MSATLPSEPGSASSLPTSPRLQDQASKAALYSTHPERAANSRNTSALGPDGKLSSAGAASSLKRASAHELPGFPVVGIEKQTSGLAAASLAEANKKSFQHWKPDPSADAGKAAMLAKDFKMAPSWHPEASTAGSKAALLAHRDGTKPNRSTPGPSTEGNSAAGIAFRNHVPSRAVDYGYTPEGRRGALLAATLSVKGRRRSDSSPAQVPSYPDAARAEANALNAAAISHRASHKSLNRGMDLTHLGDNVPREMFTENPPVAAEVEEQNHQAALRASALSMAKQMYEAEQHAVESQSAVSSAISAAGQSSLARGSSISQQARQYLSIQEAAQKLAAERLSKLDPDGATRFRSYYLDEPTSSRKRLSIKNRARRRTSSEAAGVDSDDEEQSRRIRSQMSQFTDQLAQVDAKKRQKDREALLAAAECRVHAQMHQLDEKVFLETGKVTPAMMEGWEAKAREKAAKDSESRLANYGKVHLGGGKFMLQSEIDEIAKSRLQPTLDGVGEAAIARRARDEEIRLEKEEKRRQAALQKERQAEMKAETRKSKRENEEKAKAEKEAAKAKSAEERRLQQEGRQQTGVAPVTQEVITKSETDRELDAKAPGDIESAAEPATAVGKDHGGDAVSLPARSSESTAAEAPTSQVQRQDPTSTASPPVIASPVTSPTKDPDQQQLSPKGHRRFGLLLNKFKKKPREPGRFESSQKSFVGGHTLTGSRSNASDPPEVAESGQDRVKSVEGRNSPSISSLSSSEDNAAGDAAFVSSAGEESNAEYEEARDAFDERLVPPPKFERQPASQSPVRETRFHEEM